MFDDSKLLNSKEMVSILFMMKWSNLFDDDGRFVFTPSLYGKVILKRINRNGSGVCYISLGKKVLLRKTF